MQKKEMHRRVIRKIMDNPKLSDDYRKRIKNRYFRAVPSYVAILANEFGFGSKRILDIGSNYGQSLFHWGGQSEGVDVNEEAIAFTRACGYTVHTVNIDDEPLPSGPFEGVFTNNLYEHVVAPHLFLARIFRALQDDGILAIGYPIVPPSPVRKLWELVGITPWLAPEHINFYTIPTAELILNRAGFEVIHRFAPRPYEYHPLLSKMLLPVYIHCFSVCRKIPGFRYPPERLPEHDPAFCHGDLACYRTAPTIEQK